jgi:hypothetical protein
MSDTATSILFRGKHYVVRCLDIDPAADIIVCFEYWKPEPTLEGEFAGEGFFRHRGINAIGVMAARNCWYQEDEILTVIAHIRRAANGRRLIGYGGSMGGYALINFADLLGLYSLVAIIPQFSIDAARAPYEKRWRAEAAAIDFKYDRIADVPRLTRGYLVFDPWCVDGKHAADIQKTHGLTEIRVYCGGHAQFLLLQQLDMLSNMLLDMFASGFDPARFRRDFRARRRTSAAYWLGLAETLAARGRIAAARRALLQARTLPHPEPPIFDSAADKIAGCETARAPIAAPPPAPWAVTPPAPLPLNHDPSPSRLRRFVKKFAGR